MSEQQAKKDFSAVVSYYTQFKREVDKAIMLAEAALYEDDYLKDDIIRNLLDHLRKMKR